MPIVTSHAPSPHWLLRNGHVHSIWTYYTRLAGKSIYERRRIETPDDDFLDLDMIEGGHDRVVLVLHGIDGNTDRHYIRGFSRVASQNNYDVCAMNARGCSGELNRKYASYHSGQTYDVHLVCEYLAEKCGYKQIFLAGFSLGGCLVYKYLGESTDRLSDCIIGGAAVSTPVDLKSGCERLARGIYKGYSLFLLYGLKPRIIAKMKKHNRDSEEIRAMRRATNFIEFDRIYTAPAHGFKDEEDYWRQCSSRQFLSAIDRPVLGITAVDDPFLSEECYPYAEAARSEYLYFETPLHGGHVGFAYRPLTPSVLWFDQRVLEFFDGLSQGIDPKSFLELSQSPS